MRGPLTIKQLHGYIAEAERGHSDWRKEAWTDSLFRDGKQWTQADYNLLVSRGINPLTVNRVFPVVNMLCGTYAKSPFDLVAKGRTQADAEISQVMSEALKFVMDQNGGFDKIYNAFEQQIVTGYSAMGVETNPDPRKEPIKLRHYPWYTLWWDVYSDPWLNPESCRYAYYADWKDLDAVAALVPDKRQDLMEHYGELSHSSHFLQTWSGEVDQGTHIEEQIRYLSSGSQWVDRMRKRIRPVEMWYTVNSDKFFATLPDGRVLDIEQERNPNAQYQMVQMADSVVRANVKTLRVALVVGNLILYDIESPLPHDGYPFIPFIGYLDSYRHPFGVVRQIREQNQEVNKRRSMALSLISNRRVIMERNSAEDANQVYEECNSQDGLIILNDGKSQTFQIQELGTMASQQMDVMVQSEREIQEISGANNEALGYQTAGSQSNMALETKQKQSNTMTASLTLNLKRSQKMLSEKVIAHIQRDWSGPKVLRVTDRVTGAEKFTEVNTPQMDPNGVITIRNDVTQGRYDVVVTDAPMTDTTREKYLELVFSAIQKSPAEALAPLLNLAFELTNLPHKDQLLYQLRMALGVEAIDPTLTKAEIEARAAEQKQQVEQQQAAVAQQQQQLTQLEAQKLQAEIQEILSKIAVNRTKAETDMQKAEVLEQKENRESFVAGHQLVQDVAQMRQMEKPKSLEEDNM